MPNLPGAGTNSEFSDMPLFSVDQSPAWGQADYIRPLPSWKGKYFVLIETDTYFGYGFTAYSASAKTTICGLTEFLIHHHCIQHSIASDEGTHFTVEEV